ncbi:hypothetical protein LIER_33905 [Lithospermum erythrorhizon]|uniref:Uncharacterized protein n=1 Tax=Lithospermum erythrorhizon TaxID=34254 RepID=A0AAV3S1U0_LITER
MIEDISIVDEEDYVFMSDKQKGLEGKPEHWCWAFFCLEVQSDMLCNNLSESFNFFILSARDKAIITMFERIKRLCMERIKNRRLAIGTKPGPLCPRINKILERFVRQAGRPKLSRRKDITEIQQAKGKKRLRRWTLKIVSIVELEGTMSEHMPRKRLILKLVEGVPKRTRKYLMKRSMILSKFLMRPI